VIYEEEALIFVVKMLEELAWRDERKPRLISQPISGLRVGISI
jgi:hypothetical protein